jgi:DNA-binding transcriptional LysR family regulator
MVSLDRFIVFRAVVESGSFTAAATALGQARAAVSFHIKQLEAELGVALLTRTTRRVQPTEAGERFYRRCLRVLEEAENAIEEARGEHGGMHGMLRVTTTVEYGLAVVGPALHAFTQAHPTLRVRLETHTAQADLMRDRFDVAIRLGRPEQFADLPYRGVRLGSYDIRPVIAPALLATIGKRRIASPEALARLPQLGHSRLEHIAAWTLQDRSGASHRYEPSANPPLTVDNASVLRLLARRGAGVALLPDWLVREDLADGTLIDALPGYRFPTQGIYALYLSQPHVPRKVRAWVDFMKAYVGAAGTP